MYFCTTNQILFQLLWTMALVTRIVAALRIFAKPSRCGVKHGMLPRAELSYALLKLHARRLLEAMILSLDKTCWDAGVKIAPVPNPG